MEKVIAIATSTNPDLDRLASVLQALHGQVDHAIISDNNSRAEIKNGLRSLEAKFPGFITFIWNPENLGIGAALNNAAHMAMDRGATWVLTLDDDSIPGTDMVATLLHEYHALPAEGQGRIGLMMPNEKTPKNFAYPPDGPPRIHDDGGTTAGQMVKTSILPIVGFWNEGFIIDCVDGEFCFRVRQHGFMTLLVPRVSIYTRPGHPVIRKFFGKTVSIPNYAPYRYYYMTRNLTYLYIRNFGTYILRNKYWYRAFWAIIVPRFFIKMVLFEDNRREKVRAVWLGLQDSFHGRLGKMPGHA
jgi:rhamnosyltransferase